MALRPLWSEKESLLVAYVTAGGLQSGHTELKAEHNAMSWVMDD